MDSLRSIPSVDRVLQTPEAAVWISQFGRPATLEAVRTVLSAARSEYKDGHTDFQQQDLLTRMQETLASWFSLTLKPVINATGVILHTNLGRAPLSKAALNAVQVVADGYCTLEFDLANGQRGDRASHVEQILKLCTGVEAAFVVNNNAAAVLLVLSALANRKRTIISRTQMVEIGGGFRIPEVLRQSGTKLVEIGTTNQVHITDFEEALSTPAAVVLLAHPSNFRMIGFTSEPPLKEICTLAHERGALVVYDLGSGVFLDTEKYGLAHEPTVQESLAAGADIVCFSGDKLLGGPQAGIILGSTALLAKIRKHPLARALRPDKLCLGALSVTLIHYLKEEAEEEIPVWKMISQTPEEIKKRAIHWQKVTGAGEVISGFSTIGGGSLPGEVLPTFLLAIKTSRPNALVKCLRELDPPIIARVWEDNVVLDPRTVLMEQEEPFLNGLKKVCRPEKGSLIKGIDERRT